MKKILYLVILAIFINVSFVYAENYDLSQASKAKAVTEYPNSAVIGQMDTVTFGSYPQSDESGDVKEPIEWLVLDKQEDKVLLLSKYILDHADYNYKNKDITWEESSIRKWLNRTFYKKAFNSEEQNIILTTNVINNDTINYSLFGEPIVTPGGNNTSDNVFLLSIDEVKKYFYQKDMHTSNRRLATDGTNYAKRPNEKGERLGDKAFYAWGGSAFWLRSPGMMKYDAAWVNEAGSLEESGTDVSSKIGIFGVRPAIWVLVDAFKTSETQKMEETKKAIEIYETDKNDNIQEVKDKTQKTEEIKNKNEDTGETISNKISSTEYTLNTNWYPASGVKGITKGKVTKVEIRKSNMIPIGTRFVVGHGNKNNEELNAYLNGTEVIILVPNSAKLYSPEDSSYLFSMVDKNSSTRFKDFTKNLKIITGLNLLDTSRTKKMEKMFEFNDKLESIDLSSFDTTNVTNMKGMFWYCEEIKSLDISSFDTRNVTDMSNMFEELRKIKEIKFGNKFVTNKVTKMRAMFYVCMNIETIDVSTLDTSKVIDMWGMFGHCDKLKTIYVSSKFTTKLVTKDEGMFKLSEKLVGGNGTKFDDNHIDKEYARIDTVDKPGYFTLKQ